MGRMRIFVKKLLNRKNVKQKNQTLQTIREMNHVAIKYPSEIQITLTDAKSLHALATAQMYEFKKTLFDK